MLKTSTPFSLDHSKLIDDLGGTATVARLLGIKSPSVSEWRGNGIPEARLIELAPIAEKRGLVTRKELFPTKYMRLWPDLADAEASE